MQTYLVPTNRSGDLSASGPVSTHLVWGYPEFLMPYVREETTIPISNMARRLTGNFIDLSTGEPITARAPDLPLLPADYIVATLPDDEAIVAKLKLDAIIPVRPLPEDAPLMAVLRPLIESTDNDPNDPGNQLELIATLAERLEDLEYSESEEAREDFIDSAMKYTHDAAAKGRDGIGEFYDRSNQENRKAMPTWDDLTAALRTMLARA